DSEVGIVEFKSPCDVGSVKLAMNYDLWSFEKGKINVRRGCLGEVRDKINEKRGSWAAGKWKVWRGCRQNREKETEKRETLQSA
ncbi:MAG: hypothetical protein II375_09170, partial [Bacteroidales bacterium]|nr:hypothetical protein [Bacteroidales bacterium]